MMDVDPPPYASLFARAPVYDPVFACLSPRTLVRLALTCRAAYLAAAEFKARAFNVNRHFSRYFTDPLAFRSLQAKTNTLVSGSNALQFLDRTFYPEADLDLYTHPGHSFEVAQFLVEAQGYVYAPRETQEEDWKVATKSHWDGTDRRVPPVTSADRLHAYPMTEISAVWTFKKTGRNQECLTVQIVEASSSPLECILGFHSTCVMNFISSDAAFSLYPIATFEHRTALGMPSSHSSPAAVQKYIARGWRIYFMPPVSDTANPGRTPFLLDYERWVTDEHTWVIPLDQTGVKARPPLSRMSAPLACDPVRFNGWWLAKDKSSEVYDSHYYPLQTTVFRYNYALPHERTSFSMRAWAHQQGKYSHGQISKENWIWFDADIPGFLDHKI